MDPRLLAIDCSTDRLSVAVVAGGRRRACSEPGAAAASARLLPLVLELLQACGVRLDELDAIAFGRGPGAFTGLRTACAVAQGLALGSGRPVLPLDSLMLVAEAAAVADTGTDAATGTGTAADAAAELWVAMDARMDEVYAARYRREADHWRTLDAPALYTLPALAARWQSAPPARVAGSAIGAFAHRLPFGQARLQPDEGDRAAALLAVAAAQWRRSGGLDAALALPLYLRDKVALTTAERQAAAAAAAA